MSPTDLSAKSWLLLLPRSPSSANIKALRDAFGPAIRHTLRLASKAARKLEPTILDVAIAYNESSSNDPNTVTDYCQFQRLLGLTYRLICIICTEESIDAQYGNDVDVRVAFIDAKEGLGNEWQDNDGISQSPLLLLKVLALCRRPWKHIFSLLTEDGEDFLKDFVRIRQFSSEVAGEHYIERINCGISNMDLKQNLLPSTGSTPRIWKTHPGVAVGGTFDHLHAGHKLLLTITALLLSPDPEPRARGRSLTIGITGDKLLQKKKYVDQMQEWDERQRAVQGFLLGIFELRFPSDDLKTFQRSLSPETGARTVRQEFGSGLLIHYVEIFDPFGPTITDESISALVISGETRAGGQAVNDKREAKGWPLLEVFEVDVLDAEDEDDGSSDGVKENYEGKISSTEIRRRLHDRHTAGISVDK